MQERLLGVMSRALEPLGGEPATDVSAELDEERGEASDADD